jgi:hypothetical protein
MKRSVLSIILLSLLILSGCGGSSGGSSSTGYILDISQSGLGTVTVNPVMARYPSGTAVEVTAKPAMGSFFWYWNNSADVLGQNFSDSFNITMDADKHLKAYFTKETSFFMNGVPHNGSYYFRGDMFKMMRNGPGDFEIESEYNNAEFSVNKIKLTYDMNYNGNFSINPGNQVAIIFNHQLTGTFSATLTCPAQVTGLTLAPGEDLDAWLKGDQKTLSLSWNAVPCDEYSIWITGYDKDGNSNFTLFGTNENFITFSDNEKQWIINELGSTIDYIKFYVIAESRKNFSDFFSSYFEIDSLPSNELTNLPPEMMSKKMVIMTNPAPKRVWCEVKYLDGRITKEQRVE